MWIQSKIQGYIFCNRLLEEAGGRWKKNEGAGGKNWGKKKEKMAMGKYESQGGDYRNAKYIHLILLYNSGSSIGLHLSY